MALDPYSFVRDAYLQRRASMVLGHKTDSESTLPNYEDDEDDAAPAPGTGAPKTDSPEAGLPEAAPPVSAPR